MERYRISIGETYATLITAKDFVPLAEKTIRSARIALTEYIEKHPSFRTSMQPIAMDESAPPIVKHMIAASMKTQVGPMAAVAGAIAYEVVNTLVEAGANHIVFDNGGDIALYLQEPVIVGIYTGSQITSKYGFQVAVTNTILGICTSSATVGHSVSLGISDASIVVSDDVTLADAAATYLGNLVSVPMRESINQSLRTIMECGVEGAMVVVDELVGTAGNLPDIVRADVDYALISQGMEVV
ncbi:MAG: hypothetical protein BAJATHORv1_10520 [Candidatus Thorarchaeota archaeon]|nr:MAG: hypothetical protein BAJATHORv1_10520 [Candidatus Thorarchaeota archaeon]